MPRHGLSLKTTFGDTAATPHGFGWFPSFGRMSSPTRTAKARSIFTRLSNDGFRLHSLDRMFKEGSVAEVRGVAGDCCLNAHHMKLCPQCDRKSLNSATTCECGYSFHDSSDTSQRQLQRNSPTEAQNACMSGPGEFKSCPFCKEQIRQEAVKCRFCGEWLENGRHSLQDKASKGNIPETPPTAAQQRVRPSDFHVGAIARDVAILWVLTFIAGFLSSAAMRPVSV